MKKYILLYILGAVLFSCNDPYEGTTFTAYEDYPISKYLDTHPEDFSLWVELLKFTDLYNTFNLYESYTAFVPNNKAMQHYLDSFGYASVSDIGLADADYLVKYHTLYNKVLMQAEFTNGVIETPTVTDDNLTITYREGGINDIYVNDYAHIAEFDVEVINGVIHVLDDVLVPEVATIYTKLGDADYSIMKAAVDATGYDDLLSTISVEDVDEDGFPIIKRYYYTLFAVSDDVYNAMGINSFQDLASELGADPTYMQATNPVNKYVAYHILSQINASDVLGTFEEGQTSKNINTLADKELINLSSSETGMLQINYNEQDGSSTSITKADISCKNGIMHDVDTWMPVTTPPTTTVDWDLANYADLAAICDYFQSDRPLGGSGTYRKEVPMDEVAAYQWSSVPVTKEGVITYVNNRNNDGVRFTTLYHDHLRISTGAGGWVEITSPVLVKGTYKVSLQYVSYLGTGTNGNMQCYMDGEKLGASFFVSNTSSERLNSKVLTESITFESTDSHVLRVVGLDDSELRLDYIKFEPIN